MLDKENRSETPESKTRSGLISVAKTAAETMVENYSASKTSPFKLSHQKRSRSPLPIPIEFIEDHNSTMTEGTGLTLLDILSVNIPQLRFKKDWRTCLAQEAEEELQKAKPHSLKAPMSKPNLLNIGFGSSALCSIRELRDYTLGKRSPSVVASKKGKTRSASQQPKQSPPAPRYYEDLSLGVDDGMINWSEITFKKESIKYLLQGSPVKMKKPSQDYIVIE